MIEKQLQVQSLCPGVHLDIRTHKTDSCITAILRAKEADVYLAYANVELEDAHLNDRGAQWELWLGGTSFDIGADAAAQIAATFGLRIDTIGKAAA